MSRVPQDGFNNVNLNQQLNEEPERDENINALNIIEKDLDRILKKITDSDNLLLKLESQIKKYQQRENELQQQIDKMDIELNQTNTIISTLQTEKQQFEERIQILENEKQQLQNQLKQVEQEIGSTKNELKDLGTQRINVVNVSKQNELLKQKIQDLETERERIEQSLASGSDVASQLKQQLDDSQAKIVSLESQIIKLNKSKQSIEVNKNKNQKVIEKIKSQIISIEQKITGQTAKIGEMGKFTITDTSTTQIGSGPQKVRKPIINRIKALQYLQLFPLIDKSNNLKLKAIGRILGMDLKKYPLKKDLAIAIKLALHCKAGIIKHSRELKIVGKNMQIIEITKMKTKGEMCKILDKKLAKISLRKIQKLLM